MTPTPNTGHKNPVQSSRKFDRNSYTEPDDFSNQKSKRQRSVAYARPLDFTNNRTESRNEHTHLLTQRNLELLTQSLASQNSQIVEGSDPTLSGSFMRNFKPNKKNHNRNSKDIEHPLNLPADQLRKLSQRMAQNPETSAKSMDVDMSESTTSETQADAGSTSQPETQASNPPGAFPETNGDMREDTKSPTPPPHRVNTQPKVDPEAAKAAGNKFFKAKDYTRAVAEYSKGEFAQLRLVYTNQKQPLKQIQPTLHTSRTVPQHTCRTTNSTKHFRIV